MTDDTTTQKTKPGADLSNPFSSVPIEITISVGKARPMIRDLLSLGKDAVLPLDRRVDDAVELYIGERLIARGQLEELDGETGRTTRGASDRSRQSPDGLG